MIFPLRVFCSRVIVTPYSRNDLASAIECSASIPGFTCPLLPWKWPRFRGEIYLDGGITLLLSKVCVTPQQANGLNLRSDSESIVYIFPQMFSFSFPSIFHYFLFGSKDHYFRMFQRGYMDAKKFNCIFEKAWGIEARVGVHRNIGPTAAAAADLQSPGKKRNGQETTSESDSDSDSSRRSSVTAPSIFDSLDSVHSIAEMEVLGASNANAQWFEEKEFDSSMNQDNDGNHSENDDNGAAQEEKEADVNGAVDDSTSNDRSYCPTPNGSSKRSKPASVSTSKRTSKDSSLTSTRTNSVDLTLEAAAMEELIDQFPVMNSVGQTHLQPIDF